MSSLLLANLREYRQICAMAEKTPIYCVFGDTVMRAISQGLPRTLADLQTVRGMTGEKCDKYGRDILSIVQSCSNKTAPAIEPPPASVVLKAYRDKYSRRSFHSIKASPAPGEGIYVLELTQGRVYVGRTSDMKRRVGQHMSGRGSAFTQAFPPTGVLLPRLGQVRGSDEAAERDETLRYMFLRGIPLVRGWKYTRVAMSDHESQDAEENIRELTGDLMQAPKVVRIDLTVERVFVDLSNDSDEGEAASAPAVTESAQPQAMEDAPVVSEPVQPQAMEDAGPVVQEQSLPWLAAALLNQHPEQGPTICVHIIVNGHANSVYTCHLQCPFPVARVDIRIYRRTPRQIAKNEEMGCLTTNPFSPSAEKYKIKNICVTALYSALDVLSDVVSQCADGDDCTEMDCLAQLAGDLGDDSVSSSVESFDAKIKTCTRHYAEIAFDESLGRFSFQWMGVDASYRRFFMELEYEK